MHLVQSGPLLFAAPIAAAAGALTFVSPCVLPLVPGYLSYVTGMSGSDAQRTAVPGGASSAASAATIAGGATLAQGSTGGGVAVATAPAPAPGPQTGRRRTVVGAALFVLGFSVIFALVGGAFGSLGFLLKDHTAGITQVLGAVTIVLGLLFAGLFERFPVAGRIMRPTFRPRAGLAGAPMLGAMFGLTWTPCAGPTLGIVATLSLSAGTALRGAILMFVYGLGLGIPFLIMAVAFQRGLSAFGFARRHARLITRIGGAMLVAVGVLEVSGAWTAAIAWLQAHWVGSYQSPL
jgi:cytochrome c-type biogenesis protein